MMRNINTSVALGSSMAQGIFLDSVGIAKSKYEAKSAIIKDADDLSTQNKLEAFDAAYAQYCLDVFACLCITGTAIFCRKMQYNFSQKVKLKKSYPYILVDKK